MNKEKLTVIEREEYLERIGYKGPREVSMEVLKNMILHHLSSIPYENLELHYQLPNVDPICSVRLPGLFEKLVKKKRGGYCMEQNFMLRLGLESVGFQVTTYLGRMVHPGFEFTVSNGDRIISNEQLEEFLENTWPTHIGLVVTLEDKRFLVDVGLAKNSFSGPLELSHGCETTGLMGKKSRIRHVQDKDYFVQLFVPGKGWNDQCYFKDEPVSIETENQTHTWMSKGPHSVDPTLPFVTMPVKGVGLVSILDQTVSIRSEKDMQGWNFVTGSGKETMMNTFESTDQDLDGWMLTYFGIEKEYRASPRFRAEVTAPEW
jgi:N-hydroxyarylamine O-acetyltransferase